MPVDNGQLPTDPQERALYEAFQKFDTNGDGRIQAKEFFNLMKSLGSFSSQEITRLFSEADTDNSGGVDWREFIKWICSGKATKGMTGEAKLSFGRICAQEQLNEASFVEEAAVSHAVTAYLKEADPDRADAEDARDMRRKQNKIKKAKSAQQRAGTCDFDVGPGYTGFRLNGKLDNEQACNLMKHYLLNGEANPLHPKYVSYLTLEFTNAYRAQYPKPAVQTDTPADGRLIIVGDTHGQLSDVLHILHQLGPPTNKNRYIINGDVADRGRQATEILLIFFAFFLADPDSIILHRGNHENEDMNSLDFDSGGGFADEVCSKYGLMAYRRFIGAFKVFSLCSVVQKEIFVVHGGLSRIKMLSVDYINSIDYTDCTAPHPKSTNVKDQVFSDLLWSDPTNTPGKFKSDRGIGVKFGPDITMKFCMQNRMRFIVRSHQVPEDGRGFSKQHDGRCVTIFSASNYCGNGGNYGAVLVLAAAHFPKYEIYEHYAVPLQELARLLGHSSAKLPADATPNQEECSASRVEKERERMIIGILEKKPQIWAHVVDTSTAQVVDQEDFEELLTEFIEGSHPWPEAFKLWDLIDAEGKVDIGKALGRWVVNIESEKYSSLCMGVVKQVYEAILGMDMDLEQSMRLFDVDGDGQVELKEMRHVLGMFDLGLTHTQLDRLTGQIFTHAGASKGGTCTKMSVQDFLGHFTMMYKSSAASEEKMHAWMYTAFKEIGKLIIKTPADKLSPQEEKAALKITAVARGRLVRKEVEQAKSEGRAVGAVNFDAPKDVVAAPAPAKPTTLDLPGPRKTIRASSTNGGPRKSMAGTRKTRKSMVPGKHLMDKEEDEASFMPKMVALFRALDSSGDGQLQTEEFVNGLMAVPGLTSLMVEGEPLDHDRLVKLVEAIDDSGNGTINYLEFLKAFTPGEEGSNEVGVSLMEDISTVLFRHRLAIRRGCLYFDEEGSGQVYADDFEKVLHGVNNVLARPERSLTQMQIDLLVEGLATEAPEDEDDDDPFIDYESLLHSFVIRDTVKDNIVKRF